MIQLIEKIEGEAQLHFSLTKQKAIEFVNIEFFSTRNIEKILQKKAALDALVINPRVCGICGHAHLIATVKALENCYENLELTQKAKTIRELTLNFEIIQNHFKWFYLTILPLLGEKHHLLKATQPSQILAKAIATLGGQYPHTSYAIPGGITSEITVMDNIRVQNYLSEVENYFYTNILHANNLNSLLQENGDFNILFKKLQKSGWEHSGKSHNRFIVFGQNSYFKQGELFDEAIRTELSIEDVQEYQNETSLAKNVYYKNRYYEVGPLSRSLLKQLPLIQESYERYGDSILTRILARVYEIPQLLQHSKKLLQDMNMDESTYIEPHTPLSQITASGIGIVEAARGTLIHKVSIEKGIIQEYEIITPTQWNLSNGTKINPAIAQKAIIGETDMQLAELIFKSFDVCSVCTTH